MSQSATYTLGKAHPAWQEARAKTVTMIVTENCQLRCRYCYLVGKNQVTLELMVGADAGDSVIALYKTLESSPLFGGVFQTAYQPPSQAEPLHRYRFTVNYAQKL